MIEKEIQQFWAAYELALNASDHELAQFMVKVAVEYSYLSGIAGPISQIQTDSYKPAAKRYGVSLETEAERISGTIIEAKRYATKEFAMNAFQRLLRRIYTKGTKASNQNPQNNSEESFSPQLFTMDGDC